MHRALLSTVCAYDVQYGRKSTRTNARGSVRNAKLLAHIFLPATILRLHCCIDHAVKKKLGKKSRELGENIPISSFYQINSSYQFDETFGTSVNIFYQTLGYLSVETACATYRYDARIRKNDSFRSMRFEK